MVAEPGWEGWLYIQPTNLEDLTVTVNLRGNTITYTLNDFRLEGDYLKCLIAEDNLPSGVVIQSTGYLDATASFYFGGEGGQQHVTLEVDPNATITNPAFIKINTLETKLKALHVQLRELKSSLENKGLDISGNKAKDIANKVGSLLPSGDYIDITSGMPMVVNNGRMENVTGYSSVMLRDAKTINDTYSLKSAFTGNTTLKSIYMDSLETVQGGALANLCDGCTGLENISMNNLTTLNGANYIFRNCTSLEEVNLPKLSQLNCSYLFAACNSLKSVKMPNVTTLYAPYMFLGCHMLTEVEFPEVLICQSSYAFSGCINLKRVSFPKLTTFNGSLSNMFYECQSLESVEFPNLTKLDFTSSSYVSSAFSGCKSLKEVHFPKLSVFTGTNRVLWWLGYNTNNVHFYFEGLQPTTTFHASKGWTSESYEIFGAMLTGAKNAVVHFPARVIHQIKELYSFANGFGGTNTTILFDINAVPLTFNVVSSGTPTYYVNNIEESEVCTISSDENYADIRIHSPEGIYFNTISNLRNGEPRTFSVDLTQSLYRQVGLNIAGHPDCTVTFEYKGYQLPVSQNGSQYYINVSIPDGYEIQYTIKKKGYAKEKGSIIVNGSNNMKSITLTVQLQSVEYVLDGIGDYGWRLATVTNPKASEDWTMLESANSHIGAHNKRAVMKVIIYGYDTFTFYINSYAETSHDYTCVSYLDAPSYATSYNNDNIYKDGSGSNNASTRSKQYDPTVFNTTNWKTVTFNNIGGDEHYFYVSYIKDGSADSYNDAGYVLINEDQ